MRVLLVGEGGREHALAWAIARSPRVEKLYCTAQNPGIAEYAECVDLDHMGNAALAEWAKGRGIDLTVVGPEVPLTLGIVDEFEARGLTVFGPSRLAAEIEGSKVFAKNLMRKYEIPTADYEVCDDFDAALAAIDRMGAPIVVKADGLAAGKGAVVCHTLAEAKEAVRRMMVERVFGEAADRVVLEELMVGEEASVFAVVDGETIVTLAPAQDHKAAYDGDQGPNTGGMGAYSPAPVVTPQRLAEIEAQILRPVVAAMQAEGRPYRGVLYAGLMLTSEGPKVVEFNCRFGDPEAQALLPRLQTDIVDVMTAATTGQLHTLEIAWDPRACVCVVLASQGYPGSYQTGFPIRGIKQATANPEVFVFQAGTWREGEEIVTAGGRVLGVSALGGTIQEAVDRVYAAIEQIEYEGKQYRRDIAHRALAASRG